MEVVLKPLIVLVIFCHYVSSQITTFSNPILQVVEKEAVVIQIKDFYYLVHANNDTKELQILKSPFLSDFRFAEKVAHKSLADSNEIHPNSVLIHRNDLYLYFHEFNYQSAINRMFAIKANNFENPMGNWSEPVNPLEQIWNETAFHGAALSFNDRLYFVWTGISTVTSKYCLYIAQMDSPTAVIAPAVILREANEDWECHGVCTVHGPAFLHNGDKVYMMFSASYTGLPETCISYMSIQTGLDPMQPSNWESAPGPVFQANPEDNVYSTRFPEFTTSPDGTETWMLYTASSDSNHINPSSRIRIDKIEFNETEGSPMFPVARENGYQQQLPSGESFKFLNPILNETANDPNVFLDGDSYYLVLPNNTELLIFKSDKLYDFRNAEKSVIYRAPEGSGGLFSGRILEYADNVYIYFYMHTPKDGNRMYVTKAENRSNLMQNWGSPVSLLDDVYNSDAYPGTAFSHNDKLYFVWAHPYNANTRVLSIAPMESPTKVTQPVVLLKEPSQTWECQGACVNDYPFVLKRNNTTFLLYTASANTSPDCSLSYMSIETGRDPLNVSSWYMAPGPVFVRNDAENVFGTCHASFTTSPDGKETWVVYQAANSATDVVANLKIRIDKVSWNENGGPVFSEAHGFEHTQAIPSGNKNFQNKL